jgi:hypothetical protein
MVHTVVQTGRGPRSQPALSFACSHILHLACVLIGRMPALSFAVSIGLRCVSESGVRKNGGAAEG